MQDSGEMYLETILILSHKQALVRSVDVACETGYSKPSVSRAMSILRRDGHIAVDGDGSITLTPSGREIAERIYERHVLLTEFLTRLGVSPEVAAADACRIEHVISPETFEKLKLHAAEKMAR